MGGDYLYDSVLGSKTHLSTFTKHKSGKEALLEEIPNTTFKTTEDLIESNRHTSTEIYKAIIAKAEELEDIPPRPPPPRPPPPRPPPPRPRQSGSSDEYVMRIDVKNIEELVEFFNIKEELYLLFKHDEFKDYIDYKIRERLEIHTKQEFSAANKFQMYIGKHYTSYRYTNNKILQMGYNVSNEIYNNEINKDLKLFINPELSTALLYITIYGTPIGFTFIQINEKVWTVTVTLISIISQLFKKSYDCNSNGCQREELNEEEQLLNKLLNKLSIILKDEKDYIISLIIQQSTGTDMYDGDHTIATGDDYKLVMKYDPPM